MLKFPGGVISEIPGIKARSTGLLDKKPETKQKGHKLFCRRIKEGEKGITGVPTP